MSRDIEKKENNQQQNESIPESTIANAEAPASENSEAENHDRAQATAPAKKTSGLFSLLANIWQGLITRQIFHKIFTLLFALAVFGAVYFYMVGHRNILTYMGIMLLMVIVYAEILVIRDHLWVIEGSMRESRKWRDVFFNQTTLRRQRFRKIVIMLFALGIFSYVYVKAMKRDPLNTPILSFMGIILMITILYYEILTIRDEVFIMLQSIQTAEANEKDDHEREKRYEKFLQQEEKIAEAEKGSGEEVAKS